MGRGLQADRGHARSGIASAAGHLLHLLQDQVVKSARSDLRLAEFARAEKHRQAQDDSRKIILQNDAKQIELELLCGNPRLTAWRVAAFIWL